MYRIVHIATGKVVNLYISSRSITVADRTRLFLYKYQYNNNQEWEIDSFGIYKIMRLVCDKSKVLNRNCSNNSACVGTCLRSSYGEKNSFVVMETFNGNMRIKQVCSGLYLTKNIDDNFLSWSNEVENDRQYFRVEKMAEIPSYNMYFPYIRNAVFPIIYEKEIFNTMFQCFDIISNPVNK